MLKVHQLSKAYDLDPILHNVSFSLLPGDRAGLIGPNGAGKTTILRIVAGQENAEGGSVQVTPTTLRVGYLPQGLVFEADDTIQQYLERQQGNVTELAAEVERLATDLAKQPEQPRLQAKFDLALAQLSAATMDSARRPAVLAALGLAPERVAPTTPVARLSGGQKTRLALAGVLLGEPQLLLLDEPTNHLDLEMLTWLEGWLQAYRGAVLIVSHDRAFLDRTVNRILELDPTTKQVRDYPGTYAGYVEAKLAEHDRLRQAYTDQQAEILHIRNTARHLRGLARLRRGGKADTNDKFAKGFFSNRSAGTVARATQMEARLERLLTDERIEKPKVGWQMKLDFGETPASGQEVIVLDDLAVGYGPVELLSGLNQQIRAGGRVAVVGPNGCGKTTLLRTMAGRLPPLRGRARLGARVRVGYMAQEQELLDPALDALGTVQAAASLSDTDARSFLHYFLFAGDDVFVPVASLSYGERARLALASLVARGCNCLLLDEPINHLDIPSRARFELALAGFDGTVVAVVHDRYFIGSFASEVWEIVDGGIRIDRRQGQDVP